MNIKQLALILFCVQHAGAVWSMQPLAEQELADATGQDGLSIALQFPESTISYDQLILTNRYDRPNTSTQDASLVIAPTTYNTGQGVKLFKNKNNTATDLSANQIEVAMDVDGNKGNPVANINISLSDTHRIRLNPFSVYLATGDSSIFSTPRTLGTGTDPLNIRAGVHRILEIGSQGLDVLFKNNDTLGFNIQLGNVVQGAMIKLTSGSILCIANNGVCTGSTGIDNGNNPIQIHSTGGSSIKLGLKLASSDWIKADGTENDSAKGFRLYAHNDNDYDANGIVEPFGGFYAGIVDQGLLIGASGTTDKFDLTLTNLTMGDAAATPDSNTFNGLKNGSIGNIGLTGIRITDFKATVRGM